MSSLDRSAQLAEAQQRILELERDRLRIDEELKAWTMIRDGYQKLEAKPILKEPNRPGAVEAIKLVLSENPDGLTVRQIRDRLKARHVEIGNGKSYLSNLHTLLKKEILKAEPAICEFERSGIKFYRPRNNAEQ